MKTRFAPMLFSTAAVLLAGCQFCSENGLGHRQIPFLHGQMHDAKIINGQIVVSNGWSRGEGVFTLDIRNPETPLPSGGVPAAGYVSQSVIAGPYVKQDRKSPYFCYYNTGYSILVVQISMDPSKPPVLRENHPIEFPLGSIKQLRISGRKLYALCGDGLRIYDISNRSRLVLEKFDSSFTEKRAFLPLGNKFWYVNASDSKTLLCSDGTKQTFPTAVAGLYEYEGTPLVLLGGGTLTDASGETILTGAQSLSIDHEGIKYLTKEKDAPLLYHIRKSKDSRERVFELPPEITANCCIHSAGNLMVALRDMKFCLMQLKNGKAEIVSRTPVAYNEGSVTVNNGKAYCASIQGGGYYLYGFDCRHPKKNKTPDFSFQLPMKDPINWDFHIMIPASAVYAMDHYLFAPGALLDIAPKTPAVLADTGRAAAAIHRDGDRVLMAQGKYARIYDVSKLPELKLICEIAPQKTTDIMDILPAGKDKVCLLERYQLSVYDISDPAAPKCLETLPLAGPAYCMCKIEEPLANINHGNRLYVFPGSGVKDMPLQIVSINDPAKPKLLKTIPNFADNAVCQVIPYGKTFFINSGRFLKQYDAEGQNGINPKLIRTFSSADYGMQSYSFLAIDGKTLVGKKYSRLDVWDDLELTERLDKANDRVKGN